MDQQFSLSWNNFHGNLSKGFAGLLGKGEFVDVTIAVDGHLLQAHKVILSICSPYFKKMFQTNPCQHPIVVLRDVTHKSMQDLLQFMYHGEVSVKREDLTSFIGTAEVLQIKGLTNKEIDEDENDQKRESPSYNQASQNNIFAETESCVSDTTDTQYNENVPHNDTHILKQRDLLERIQNLSNFKRKSEEFIQNNFYSSDVLSEKRPKLKDKSVINKTVNTTQSNFENMCHYYGEVRKDVPANYTSHSKSTNQNANMNQEPLEKIRCGEISPGDTPIDLKTETEESDIVLTDTPISTPLKNYEDTNTAPEYPATQDNASELKALFAGLKNHHLTTIPQKEDGKKKYPQRSCRLCWKIGKRRDTRFMCSTCELPFCKAPCFEIHFNDILAKATQFHDCYTA